MIFFLLDNSQTRVEIIPWCEYYLSNCFKWFPFYVHQNRPVVKIVIKNSEDIMIFKLKYQTLICGEQSYAK